MTELTITPLYAALIAFLMAGLSIRVGFGRGKHGVALGDGGNSDLALRIRRFGNLSEYAAMAVLLLALMELRGIDDKWLHAYGGALVAFRAIHPFALFDSMDAPFLKKAGRLISAAGTAGLLVAAGAALIF